MQNTLTQNLLPDERPIVKLHKFSSRVSTQTTSIVQNGRAKHIGLAVKINPSGVLEGIAFATPELVVELAFDDAAKGVGSGGGGGGRGGRAERMNSQSALAKLLLGEGDDHNGLVGFGMTRLALHIFGATGLHVRGYDLAMTNSRGGDFRSPSQVVEEVYKTSGISKRDVDRLWDHPCEKSHGFENMCLRAWIAACVASSSKKRSAWRDLSPLDTRNVPRKELRLLSTFNTEYDLLEEARPQTVQNEFNSFRTVDGYQVEIYNARYRNRLIPSTQAVVVMTNSDGREFRGEAVSYHGKRTTVSLPVRNGVKFGGILNRVQVEGREDLNPATRARLKFTTSLLQGIKWAESAVIQSIWFPSGRGAERSSPDSGSSLPHLTGMNESQRRVVAAMTSSAFPITLTQGPPGTGKTATIAAASKIWQTKHAPVWIVAHSNVAVKNVAEALNREGVDFKIIVSRGFYEEWHEHLYLKIKAKLLRADQLNQGQTDLGRLLGGSKIILCTLNMLSNPMFETKGMFDLVPLRILVVDEASQINIADYLHVFRGSEKTLQKVCFFGDGNQLPPFGKDRVPTMKCIFDVEHLIRESLFLDTQYRLPTPLGDFVSRHVYDGRVKSEHTIHEPSCVSFVDVEAGQEIQSGFSWKNVAEIKAIVYLVRNYYHKLNFCVITPYDAQRAAIENELKSENLPFDRVFNVDSFQGNQADYTLISLVRTEKVGFLASKERMNVMITRCRKGMVVVTKYAFLRRTKNGDSGAGSRTLVGELARHWEGLVVRGRDNAWVDSGELIRGNTALPGCPARGTVAYFSRQTKYSAISDDEDERNLNWDQNSGRESWGGNSNPYRGPNVVPTCKPFDVKALFPALLSPPTTNRTPNTKTISSDLNTFLPVRRRAVRGLSESQPAHSPPSSATGSVASSSSRWSESLEIKTDRGFDVSALFIRRSPSIPTDTVRRRTFRQYGEEFPSLPDIDVTPNRRKRAQTIWDELPHPLTSPSQTRSSTTSAPAVQLSSMSKVGDTTPISWQELGFAAHTSSSGSRRPAPFLTLGAWSS